MEGTIMLMPASEAWKRVEDLIADDLKKIEEAVEEAIRDECPYAEVDSRLMRSEAVKEKLEKLGYRWNHDPYRIKLYFSPKDESK